MEKKKKEDDMKQVFADIIELEERIEAIKKKAALADKKAESNKISNSERIDAMNKIIDRINAREMTKPGLSFIDEFFNNLNEIIDASLDMSTCAAETIKKENDDMMKKYAVPYDKKIAEKMMKKIRETEFTEKKEPEKEDAVNSPKHYQGKIECREAMERWSSPHEVFYFFKLSAFKYLWRKGNKGPEEEDIKKAKRCVELANEAGARVGLYPLNFQYVLTSVNKYK